MNEFQLGKIVGLIEGEGCFTASYRKRKNTFTLRPCVYVGMTNEEPVRQIKEWTNLGKVYIRKRKDRRKPFYIWITVSNQETLQFCKMLLFYLTIKKEQCLLMIKFLNSRIPKETGGLSPKYTEEEISYIRQIRNLNNQKGKWKYANPL
jgi:hypothetical protein